MIRRSSEHTVQRNGKLWKAERPRGGIAEGWVMSPQEEEQTQKSAAR